MADGGWSQAPEKSDCNQDEGVTPESQLVDSDAILGCIDPAWSNNSRTTVCALVLWGHGEGLNSEHQLKRLERILNCNLDCCLSTQGGDGSHMIGS